MMSVHWHIRTTAMRHLRMLSSAVCDLADLEYVTLLRLTGEDGVEQTVPLADGWYAAAIHLLQSGEQCSERSRVLHLLQERHIAAVSRRVECAVASSARDIRQRAARRQRARPRVGTRTFSLLGLTMLDWRICREGIIGSACALVCVREGRDRREAVRETSGSAPHGGSVRARAWALAPSRSWA